MISEKQSSRINLRRFVAVATGLPILTNAIVIVLYEMGKLGRCDGIHIIGSSFMVSIILFLAALVGTLSMIKKREGEPLWILILAALIQMACLTYVAVPFIRF